MKTNNNPATTLENIQAIKTKGYYQKDPAERRALQTASIGYYGIEIRYRNETVERYTLTTSYNLAAAATHGAAHNAKNHTRKTPQYARLFLLEPTGKEYALIEHYRPYSQYN